MKFTLYVYVTQPQKGHWEVSVPWVAELAAPLRGPSPAQLKEELMFRVLELVHNELKPTQLDRLLPPSQPYLTTNYIEVVRKVDADRPPQKLSTTTHVVIASGDDGVIRMWPPKAPGVCLPVASSEEVYAALQKWVVQWAEDNDAHDLERLSVPYLAAIEQMELDLGWPTGNAVFTGRLVRPETLHVVATNLSYRAEDDVLGRAFGRDQLVDELVDVLMSPRPQNICLVGPVGVGKTAIFHEAARRMFELANSYQDRRDIWQTSGDRIIAGMSIIGQWEQRTEALCRELAERQDVLFVDDLLGLVRAGRTSHGDSSVARFIEPYLEQGQFSVIAEATEETWLWARASAPGFVDKFRRIRVPELTYRETLGVVSDLIREVEATQRLRFTADGVETLLHLARRFFRTEAFPGKAVRLVRQCQHDALRTLDDMVRVDPDRVAQVVHRQTGLPRTILRPGYGRSLDEVRQTFESRVFGQPRAVEVVSRLVTTIEQGLTDPQRPLAALLLVGPSGVGKTETAKALALDLFGDVDRMIRFDMSEFSGASALSRLIGTPSQPDGELTSKVRLQPFCVLLFDEIEKADPMVLDLLLQVLGDGRLTDAAGRTVDFRNATIVMTSNLGASSEDRWLGFGDQRGPDRTLHYRRAAEDFFSPELFNRIDQVVPYDPLGPDALRRIARRTLQNLLERRGLRQAQMMVDVDEGLIDFLVEKSVDPRYGARTLASRIEQTLVVPLAKQMTSWKATDSLTRVTISPDHDGVRLMLQSVDRAPTGEFEPRKPATTHIGVMQELAEITRAATELLDDTRRAKIDADYQQLLARINEVSGDKAKSRALADDLRRHESVLGRLGALERRVAGLQDPRGTGQFLYESNSDRQRKGHIHRWGKIAAELRVELHWIREQLDAVDKHDPGVTVVWTGLSGPSRDLLAQWASWLQELDQAFGLEAVWGWRDTHGRWHAGMFDTNALGFAVSTMTPGASALLAGLIGFTWSPRPASHGQHALAAARRWGPGHGDIEQLLSSLGSDTVIDLPMFIEFIEREGQVDDVRLGRTLAVPDDRGQNLRSFVVDLVFSRLTAVTKVADE